MLRTWYLYKVPEFVTSSKLTINNVDDVIVTGTDSAKIDSLKRFLHDQFKIKDLGRLNYFLGLEVLYKQD